MTLTPSDANANSQPVFATFVDILYAVVLGQSFVLLNSIQIDPIANALQLATIFLVYALVVTSWYGYHHSIRRVPIVTTWRWVVDVVLLFVYYAGFVAASKIGPTRGAPMNLVYEPILWVFVATFLLYTVWDGIRLIEYRKRPEVQKYKLVRRAFETFAFAMFFLVITVVYILGAQGISGIEWAYFVGIAVLLVAFRLIKLYKD